MNTPPAPHGEGELIVHPITPQPIGVVTIYPGISADVVRNFLRQPVKALILRSYGVGPPPIGVVTIYPGITADVVRKFLRQPVKALILRSQRVGNAPQNTAFLLVLQEASDRGIVVVNLSHFMSGKENMGGYATGNALAHAGVIGGADMTVEATLTKLHYLLSQELDTETIRPVKALILRSQRVGNAPQNTAFLLVLQEASDRGIVVVNLSHFMSGKENMGGYATGNALAHAGVIGGADMTVEATLTKLHYLLSQELDTETIRKAMSQMSGKVNMGG